MRYLLDTNALSEFRKKQPNLSVVIWLNQTEPETIYLSVISVGELKRGIEKLTDKTRKQALQAWLEDDLLVRFHGRLVGLGLEALLVWGTLVARLEAPGKPMPVMDSLIAAVATQGDFTLVTRNEADFAQTGVKTLNPWT
ncbi:MAG: type II toxin-antitoxin system VapC family toxin [Anaerolineae bacterium]